MGIVSWVVVNQVFTIQEKQMSLAHVAHLVGASSPVLKGFKFNSDLC